MEEKFKVTNIPWESLEDQKKTATDSVQKSFTGLMSAIARKDQVVEMEGALKKLPVQLARVEDYISAVSGRHPG